MPSLRILLALALGGALMGCPPAPAKPAFISSEIEGPASDIIFCDLDGDHLKDAVLVDGLNLSIFYQDSKLGFPRRPQQQYRLDDRPAVVWPARLGRKAESLLVMTSEGVTELCFTNRTGPPACTQIIQQQTIIPSVLDETQVMYFPLSADTGTDWPLLLVPVSGGFQVWQHREGWRQAQFIEHAVDTQIQPSVANPGYTRSFALSMSLADVNGDGRDDLMVMRNVTGGLQTYALYLQKADGLFTAEPAMTYTNKPAPAMTYMNKPDGRTALYWVDINRDGKLDLIKSTTSDEPSFVPWMPSGKALVGVYLADPQGRIPAEPQQVFRKHDWSPALPVVDVDGDGFVDLALGHIPIDTREGVRRLVTTEQLDYTLKFYFFRPGAGFPNDPDCQRRLLIHLNRAFFGAPDNSPWITLQGDFNGDGKKDLLVRDHADEFSVYFFVSREKGFSSEPDLKFHCPEPIEWWQVRDLNGDGVSDLIVKLQKRNAFRIFTSQRK